MNETDWNWSSAGKGAKLDISESSAEWMLSFSTWENWKNADIRYI